MSKWSEPDFHWRRMVWSKRFDGEHTAEIRWRQGHLGRPLRSGELFRLAHKYAAKAERDHSERMGPPHTPLKKSVLFFKSRAVKGNVHVDPRSNKAVVVASHADKRATKKPKAPVFKKGDRVTTTVSPYGADAVFEVLKSPAWSAGDTLYTLRSPAGDHWYAEREEMRHAAPEAETAPEPMHAPRQKSPARPAAEAPFLAGDHITIGDGARHADVRGKSGVVKQYVKSRGVVSIALDGGGIYEAKVENVAKTGTAKPIRKSMFLFKSRAVRGNSHIDPRSNTLVVVPDHRDRRDPKRPKATVRRRPAASAPHTPEPAGVRSEMPAQWNGQGEQVPPTPEQLKWALDTHGERLPPGKPIEGGGHTVHSMRTYDPPLNGKVIAEWYDSNGKKQARYTKAHRDAAAKKKWDFVPVFAKRLPMVRKAVAEALGDAELSKTRVIAAVVACVDQTAMRIGTQKFAERDNNPTYGASSMLKEHVTFVGDSVVFKFAGKHSVHQERTVKGKAVVGAIRELMKLDGPRLFQYPDANGVPQPVKEKTVNDWLESFGVTPKQWRTFHACKLFLHALGGLPDADTEAARKKNVAAAVRHVAGFLGNTPAVARNEYIDPSLIERYMADGTIL